jgi:hypothetical protein
MKIAILITGQIRTNELCKHVIKNTLLNHYDVDVFLSINACNERQNDCLNLTEKTDFATINNIITFYNPIDTYICETYEDTIDEKIKLLSNNLPYDRRYKILLEQYYIVFKAYEMLQNHIKNTGNEYDIIIRIRFDQFIWSDSSSLLSKYVTRISRGDKVILYNSDNILNIKTDSENLKIELDNPNPNEIYLFGFNISNCLINDWADDPFWIHSSSLIPTMSQIYNELPNIINKYYKQDGPLFERLFYQFLRVNNLILKKSKVNGQLCREKII